MDNTAMKPEQNTNSTTENQVEPDPLRGILDR